ncbi:ABC transporter permease [Thermodesulfobacteriota bacterium]
MFLPSQLLKPEGPVYVVVIISSLVIVGLVGLVVWSTLLEGLPGVDNQLSLVNYLEVFSGRVFSQAVLNTLYIGIGTVLVNLFFAVPIVWLIHRTNVPFKNFFVIMLLLHLLIPHFLKVMGYILLFSPKIGLINSLLRTFIPVDTGPLSIYNVPSIAFLQGVGLTPVMFFLLSGAFRAVDPAFEEAAEVTGASKLSTIRHITLPLVLPAVVAAIIYNFMSAVAMYETAALLGAPKQIPVFSTLIFEAIYADIGLPEYGVAGVYGVLLMVPSLIALYYYQSMMRLGHRYATVTGKGYKPKLMDLGRVKWLGVGFIGFFLLLDIFLPFVVLVWVSLLPYIQLPTIKALSTMSLEGYRTAIGVLAQGGVLANTVQLVIYVSILTTLLSLFMSWIVLRTRLPGRYVIDTISMLPHAVPRIAFAFAALVMGLLLSRVIPLYGSLASIILTQTIVFISFGTRSINSALIQIHQDLEDAVQTCGGSRLVALRRVIMPLLGPTLFYVLIWTMVHAYREVTSALLLQSTKNRVMSVAIWLLWDQFNTRTAAALGVIMILGMVAVIAVILKLFPGLVQRGGLRD